MSTAVEEKYLLQSMAEDGTWTNKRLFKSLGDARREANLLRKQISAEAIRILQSYQCSNTGTERWRPLTDQRQRLAEDGAASGQQVQSADVLRASHDTRRSTNTAFAKTVALRSPETGEVRVVKLGWSWTCFLFGGFAVPLLMRRLYGLAMVVVLLNLAWIVAEIADPEVAVGVAMLQLALSFVMGFYANELTAKRLLGAGWVFAEPQSSAARRAKAAWRVPD